MLLLNYELMLIEMQLCLSAGAIDREIVFSILWKIHMISDWLHNKRGYRVSMELATVFTICDTPKDHKSSEMSL